jgi:cytochrome c oxidase subunit 3
MTAGSAAHTHAEHHWEFSWAPLVTAVGVTLLVPTAFILLFVYKLAIPAIVAMGVGVPLTLAGVSKWVGEGMSQKLAISNVAHAGLATFIVSEIMIFLSLFASYWTMRLSAESWPPAGTPHINLVLPLFMTAILVGSSLTYHKAEEELAANSIAGFKKWTLISILLGLLFVGCTAYEYIHLTAEKFVPGTNSYSTAFYSLTGFHASHVLVGALTFVVLLVTAMKKNAVNHEFARCAGIYWHFVDLVWFFVATQIYYW